MKKIQIAMWVMLVAFVAFQGVASAKTVSGKVAKVDAATNKISVSYTDPATSKEESAEISIKTDTAFSGAASLADLKEGEDVSVEAAEDAATGGWNATSVKVSAPAAKEATL